MEKWDDNFSIDDPVMVLRTNDFIWVTGRVRAPEEINSTEIAPDFGPSSRRVKGRILVVCNL